MERAGAADSLQDPLVDPLAGGADVVQLTENTRQVFSNDIESPRHAVDCSEVDRTDSRSGCRRDYALGGSPRREITWLTSTRTMAMAVLS